MEKKKTPIWKIVVAILFLPFTLMYLAFKFYKSPKYTLKQKLIGTVIFFIIVAISGTINSLTAYPSIETVTIENIELYKGEEKEIKFKITPDDAIINETSYSNYDDSIIEIENNVIKAINKGSTSVTCTIEDSNSNTIESNTFTVTVSLTEQQKAEEEKKKDEERNTISTSEGVRIKDYCESIINSVLKAPSTAEYPGSFLDPFEGWSMSKKNNLVTVVSYVDAQNSFGAMIRSEFIIQIQMNDDGSGKTTYIQFDGEVLQGQYKK